LKNVDTILSMYTLLITSGTPDDLHESFYPCFDLTFREAPFVDHIRFNDQGRDSPFFPYDLLNIVLAERIRLAASVRVHYDTVHIIPVNYGENFIRHLVDANIKVDS